MHVKTIPVPIDIIINLLNGLEEKEKDEIFMNVYVEKENKQQSLYNFETTLIKDKSFQHRLDVFDKWQTDNEPFETDLSNLEKTIET
jgi:hypothetical protein